MAIPKKPEKTADDFIHDATASQAENKKVTKQRGRPGGEPKEQFPVRLPVSLLKAIRENCAGNMTYFTEQVFRDYFKRNDINID